MPSHYVFPLRGNQDPAPRLYYYFFTVPPLSLHPLPSLISSCLNLPLGTQGRPQRLNETHFLKARNGGQRMVFVPKSPVGPCVVVRGVGEPHIQALFQNSLVQRRDSARVTRILRQRARGDRSHLDAKRQ